MGTLITIAGVLTLYVFFRWSDKDQREAPRRRAERETRTKQRQQKEQVSLEQSRSLIAKMNTYRDLPESEKAAWFEKERQSNSDYFKWVENTRTPTLT